MLRASLSPYLASLKFTRTAVDEKLAKWESTSPGKPFIDIEGIKAVSFWSISGPVGAGHAGKNQKSS